MPPRKNAARAAKTAASSKAATAIPKTAIKSAVEKSTTTQVAASKKKTTAKSTATVAKANSSKKRQRDDDDDDEESEPDTKPKSKKAKVVAAAPKASKKAKSSAKATKTTASVSKKTAAKRKADESDESDDAAPPSKKARVFAPKKAAPKKAVPKKAAPKKAAAPKKIVDPIMKIKIGAKINTAPITSLDVFVFGEGSAGELGLGAKVVDKKRPIDVKRPRKNPLLSAPEVGVVQVACGGMHGLALTKDNKILSWGVNDQGALGRSTKWTGGLRDVDAADSDSEDEDDTGLNPLESTPAEIDMSGVAPGTKFVQVAGCDSASFALTEDGRVYGWGTFRVSLTPFTD